MSRAYCQNCHRPEVSCICDFISPVSNDVRVVVLQHPSEVNHAKGTLTLLKKSLRQCQVIVGETFDEDPIFYDLLRENQGRIALLYPSEQATSLSMQEQALKVSDVSCLVILDATWKKAYRMYMLNKHLHDIPHICLPDGIKGQYSIRSTRKVNALSTLEACCYSLGILEQSSAKYQPLIENFVKFNQFQHAFKKSGINHT